MNSNIKRILLYNSGGGIGDAIQILPLINSLKEEFIGADFFYLCSHQNHFKTTLNDLNINIRNLDLDLMYFGFRWWHLLAVKKKNIQKFDLIIDLQSKIRNSLILKMIPHKYFISSCLNFKLSNPSLSIKKKYRINDNICLALNKVFGTKCKKVDFEIKSIKNEFFLESEKLLPGNNYVGLSITQGNVYRKKEWPLKNILNLCEILIKKNKIPVFFVEKKNVELKEKIQKLVPSSLFPEHESILSSPALVVCLAKRLEFAITIDNGVMHMLSLSKIPMISLFGPTNSEKFAPQYEKSIVLDSKKIYKNNDIASITAKDVLEAAEQHLNF